MVFFRKKALVEMLTFYDIQFNGILVEISNISINMEDTL